jgi:hypothetical protein
MSILAGGLHIVMMEVIVLISTAAYYTLAHRTGWLRPAIVIVTLTVTGLAAGAVQLFSSAEFAGRAVRFISGTSLPATQKIPIAYLVDSILPRALAGYLFSWNFQGKLGPGEVLSPYFGVFPLFLAIVGFWKCRERPWVRYFAGLAVAAFLFSLGASSVLYGLIYAFVPLLWMAREASRFLYLTHFALVILTAYGAQTLFYGTTHVYWRSLNRVLLCLAIASVMVLTIPLVFGQVELKPWTEWSLLLIILTYPLFRFIAGGATGAIARFLTVAFIVFDLHSFSAIALNKIEAARKDGDQLERLISMRGAADSLKSRPGPFRVQVATDPPLNIGDAYAIETLNGGAVTLSANYMHLMSQGGPGLDLLNVRYILKPASVPEPNPVYADTNWKIYENPSARPRAWIEHNGTMTDKGNEVTVQEHSSRRITLGVRTAASGILVLSELYYPGWKARVNGSPERISEVEGGLRGILVPAGESQVAVDYSPSAVMLGGILSGLTFLLILAAAATWFRG